ncbi:MAG: GerMN domain-containing protein [Actinobacteria bacterium]|nr:GerMN domain-containing protein [Actinomycetota bacterium]
MKNSNKTEKGFLFASKIPQLTIVSLILIIIITLFASGCSVRSFTGNSNIQETVKDTSIAAESTSNTESTGTQDSSIMVQDTSVTSEETGNNNSSNEEVTINVYYADQNGENLVGEARILSGSSKYVDAISEMMKEPIDSSLVKLIPESTKINSVTVKDGMAKVDLSKNFVDGRFIGDSTDILLIYSIVNTLTEFPDVNSVEFYIDGEKLNILGQLDLQEPLFRRNDLIKKD